jgi:homospermidine synthase
MLIATFGPTTAWSGKTITREGDAFVLEDHGSISAGDIMEYDRQGHLLWVNAGTRAWVGSKAQGTTKSQSRAPASRATSRTSEAQDAAKAVTTQPESPRRRYVKRALLVAIVVLAIANTALLLTLLGVFRGL